MDNSRYRVVLTGKLVQGFSREAVVAALARMFETSAGRFVELFDGHEFPVDEVFDTDGATALRERLEGVGAHARVEPVVDGSPSSASLHLPHHDAALAAGLMRCPACGHEQLVAASCDECGVVFADYNRRRPAESLRPAATAKGPVGRSQSRNTVRDIHARDANGWHDAWVDEGPELPTEEYHVNLFMGPGSTNLAKMCKRMMLGRRTHLMLTWTGGAVFSPFLWAMYRKMWAWGAVIFVCEIMLPLLLIALGNKPNVSDKLTYIGIAGIVANRIFWPMLLKYLYCRHTRLAIAALNRMSPTHASDIDIAASGGTSRTSVFVGIVLAIVVSLLSWNIVDAVHERMSRPKSVFAEPPGLPLDSGADRASGAQPGGGPVNEAVVAQNKWVVTRGNLRMLGQRVAGWMLSVKGEVEPQDIAMADISQALSLNADELVDAWGKQFMYRYENNGFVLVSAGPDGEFGSSDDIAYRRSLSL